MAGLRNLRRRLYSSHRVCHSGIGSESGNLNRTTKTTRLLPDAPGRSRSWQETRARNALVWRLPLDGWRGQPNPDAHLEELSHVDESTWRRNRLQALGQFHARALGDVSRRGHRSARPRLPCDPDSAAGHPRCHDPVGLAVPHQRGHGSDRDVLGASGAGILVVAGFGRAGHRRRSRSAGRARGAARFRSR